MDKARSSFILEALGRIRVMTRDMYDPELTDISRHAKVSDDLVDLYSMLVSEYWEEVYRRGTSADEAWKALHDATTQDGMVAGDKRERWDRRGIAFGD